MRDCLGVEGRGEIASKREKSRRSYELSRGGKHLQKTMDGLLVGEDIEDLPDVYYLRHWILSVQWREMVQSQAMSILTCCKYRRRGGRVDIQEITKVSAQE